MSKIIKRDGRFFRQIIEEDTVDLKDLENRLIEAQRIKTEFIAKETQDRNEEITEIQDEINQIKSL